MERLHGVGYRTAEKLTELGVTTVRQLRALSKEMLQRQLGPKQGQVRVRNRTLQLKAIRRLQATGLFSNQYRRFPIIARFSTTIIGPDAVALCARC